MRDFTEKEKRIMAECQRIKVAATQSLFNGEWPGRGQFRPAARRAWRKANEIQSKILASIKD